MGQAVLRVREQGGETLSALFSGGEGEEFLRDCGFAPKGGEDRTLWEKYIGFDPDI